MRLAIYKKNENSGFDEEGKGGGGRMNEKRMRDEQTDRSTQRTNSRRLPVAQCNVFMCERKEMGCVACNYKRV